MIKIPIILYCGYRIFVIVIEMLKQRKSGLESNIQGRYVYLLTLILVPLVSTAVIFCKTIRCNYYEVYQDLTPSSFFVYFFASLYFTCRPTLTFGYGYGQKLYN